jgi:hypothetical protein
MKKIWLTSLAIILGLGQAPAWALVCKSACMPQASLACLRACAKSEALLTQGGALPNIGAACAEVQARFALPSLAAVEAPGLHLPVTEFMASVMVVTLPTLSLSIVQRAHAPPSDWLSQAILSVPVAQAPPSLV